MKKLFIIAAVSLLAQGISAQTIDRSHKPKPGPAPIITVGDPVIYKLANGITVLVVENHKLPKVAASYSIDAGPITEGTKAGVVAEIRADFRRPDVGFLVCFDSLRIEYRGQVVHVGPAFDGPAAGVLLRDSPCARLIAALKMLVNSFNHRHRGRPARG